MYICEFMNVSMYYMYAYRNAIRHAFNVLAVKGPKHRVSVHTYVVRTYVCICK